MASLEEQIRRKCKHFTGIMDPCCKMNVAYKDVRVDTKPFKFPCIDPSVSTCSKREYLSEAEASQKLKDMTEGTSWALTTIVLIRHKYASDKLASSWIECPSCQGRVNYSIAVTVNNHIWATCKGCGKSFRE